MMIIIIVIIITIMIITMYHYTILILFLLFDICVVCVVCVIVCVMMSSECLGKLLWKCHFQHNVLAYVLFWATWSLTPNILQMSFSQLSLWYGFCCIQSKTCRTLQGERETSGVMFRFHIQCFYCLHVPGLQPNNGLTINLCGLLSVWTVFCWIHG